MRFLDSRGRLFGRFNAFNALLILVVAVTAAAGFYKLVVVRETGLTRTSTVMVSLEVLGVRQPSIDAVSVGDRVYGFETQILLGVVAAKRVEPHREPLPTADGRIVMAEVPGRFDLYLDVRGQATVGPNAISVSGRELKIGVQLKVTGKLFIYESSIVGVQVIGE